MSIRKILVPMDGSLRDRGTLNTAFSLARLFDAHVVALHARILAADALPFVGEGMSAALVQELVELTQRESTAHAAAARQTFQAVLQASGLPAVSAPPAADAGSAGASAGGLDVPGQDEDVIAHAGRLADLIVLARPEAADRAGGAIPFTAALFETGRPVLAAGRDAGTVATGRVVIAWDGSAQASRALAAALPFLGKAEEITVVMARDPEDDDGALAAVVDYLAWHGVAAQARRVTPAPGVAEALLAAAAGADLLVMGGYSHSRLREMILGGVTRHMLEKAPLPLLLAH